MELRKATAFTLIFSATVFQSVVQLCHGATSLSADEERQISGLQACYECYAPQSVPCDPSFTPQAGNTCQSYPAVAGFNGVPDDADYVSGDLCVDPQPNPMQRIARGRNDSCEVAVWASKPCDPPSFQIGKTCAIWAIWDCHGVCNTHRSYVFDEEGHLVSSYVSCNCTCNQVADPLSGSYVTGPTKFGGDGDPCN